MVSRPIEAYGRPGIVNFVAQYGSDYMGWVKRFEGVVDVNDDYRLELSWVSVVRRELARFYLAAVMLSANLKLKTMRPGINYCKMLHRDVTHQMIMIMRRQEGDKHGSAQMTVEEDERRRDSVLVWCSAIIGFMLLLYGIFDLKTGFQPIIGWLEIASAVVCALNVGAYFFVSPSQKQIGVQRLILAATCLTVICAVIPDGGLHGTSIYWVFVVPCAAFFYIGLLGGAVVSAVLYVFIFSLIAGQHAGYFTTYYSIGQYGQAGVVLTLSVAMGIAGELMMRRFIRVISVQQQRMQVLVGNLPVGVIFVDFPLGRPLSWNKNLEVLLGAPIDKSSVVEKMSTAFRFEQDNGKPYPNEKFPLARAIRGEGSTESDIFVKSKDGGSTVLRMTAAPVRDEGRIIGAIAVVENATKEHEIDRMKTEFVSFASHQLKTPLTGIKWSTQVLLEDGDKLGDDQRQTAMNIEKETERLSRLVSDLLDVSRIESGKNFEIVPEPVDLRVVIDGVVTDMRGRAEQKGVSIDLSRLPSSLPCEADERKMREVFMNLIGNSVKYTGPGGAVEVGTNREGDSQAIYVKDNGIGIPKAQQGKVFGRFFRADNAVGSAEGTGLGLFIVRAIVEGHGGHVGFTSEEGKGTTFTVSLPCLGIGA